MNDQWSSSYRNKSNDLHLVTFTEESLMENFIFCAVFVFHRKELVFLNLISRYVTSARQ